MSDSRLRSVVGSLRQAVSSVRGGLSDAELLRRWVAHRDEPAFEALLWRHAATVVSVCRRVLHDAHEAEDAAQAAFLTLARKASSIGRRQAVAAWLYTVAYRVAIQARTRIACKTPVDPHHLDALPARSTEDSVWRDLRPVLDEEVSRLPEKYRAPFVLCCLEGRTNVEAASELGCPVGTVLSRLARARQQLRDRLTRRGVTLTAGLFEVALADEAAAAVPRVLVRGAVCAAARAAAGQALVGIVSTEAVALMEGMVRTMFVAKLKTGSLVVLTAALLGGGGMFTYRTVAGQPGGSPQERAPAAPRASAAPTDEDKLKELLAQKEEIQNLKARLAALENSMKDKEHRLEASLRERLSQTEKVRDEAEAARALIARREEELRAQRDASRSTAKAEERPQAPTADGSRTTQVEQARDEVELLAAQLKAKRAQLDAATRILGAMQEITRTAGLDAKGHMDLATQTGQVEVKKAELGEAELRLAQATRRLAKLTSPAGSVPDPGGPSLEQRLAALQKKLDAFNHDLEALRRELPRPGPARR